MIDRINSKFLFFISTAPFYEKYEHNNHAKQLCFVLVEKRIENLKIRKMNFEMEFLTIVDRDKWKYK